MNILLTNDDGIGSEGLRALARALGKSHRVLVVAPDSERSACGHSISIMKPLKLLPVTVEGAEEAYAFGGTPVDCVKFATVEKRHFRPDFVISGINRGSNLGTDTIYSGTVSAAREAATLSIPALAVSDVARQNNDFAADAEWLAGNLERFFSLSYDGVFYNINFPACPAAERRGMMPCRTGVNLYDEIFELREGHYYLSGDPIPHENEEKCDTDYIRENYITVSPLVCDFTSERALAQLTERHREGGI